MTEKLECTRCGKEIEELAEHNWIGELWCRECQESFQQWIEAPKKND